MKVYADYAFYKDTYKGKLSEEKFNTLVIQASQYIRYATMERSDSYEGDELKYAVCEVTEIYGQFESNTNGRIVQGESNDGYSITYAAEGASGELSEQVRDRKSYQALKKWIAWTGLLSRKVRCVHDY